jgi:hypothetical protein
MLLEDGDIGACEKRIGSSFGVCLSRSLFRIGPASLNPRQCRLHLLRFNAYTSDRYAITFIWYLYRAELEFVFTILAILKPDTGFGSGNH